MATAESAPATDASALAGGLPPRAKRLPPSEIFNLGTHSGGAVLALAGTVFLVSRAESLAAGAALAFYGATLVMLYVASTLHHMFPAPEGEAGRVAFTRRFDHVSIYLHIMGTYTPTSLFLLPPAWGWPIFSAVWIFGIVGIFLKLFRPFAPRGLTAGLYVIVGWIAMAAVVPIYQLATLGGIALLLGGGVVYTVGAVIYAKEKPDVWPRYVGFHGLWHVLVLVASAMHFAFVAIYVPTS